MRFLFFYLMTDDPARVRDAAARHAAYWQQHAPQEYPRRTLRRPLRRPDHLRGRPPSQAKQLVGNDPFLVEGLVSRWWLHHWLAGAAAPAMPTGDQHE